MTTREAFVAVNRFGLGARPGELERVARDPRGWVKAQIAGRVLVPAALARFPNGTERMAEFQETRRKGNDPAVERLFRDEWRAVYVEEAAARARLHIDTDQPVRERLVQFWSNHFTVSIQRPPLLGLAGPFEREAIRPHVTGKFRDMLLASTRHQGMLVYLDNAQSIGPNSRLGQRRGRGLNENLAREILELHTVGVNGGYNQNDVREFAKILTGWSIGGGQAVPEGVPTFQPMLHEPGAKTLLGVRFEEAGEQEGIAALDMLARHPATARHIATKLARHFIADQPPAATVERLAAVFQSTDGDLGALAHAVVDLDEAWSIPLAKVKTPNEFVISALRATGFEGDGERLVGALRLLGQAPFAAPSPAGWPDSADQWIGPESVFRRAEWAMALALRAVRAREPRQLLAQTIGPVAERDTVQAIERAPSAADALALVFASPEFQRR